MLTLYLLQAFAPLALIAWLAFAPPRSLSGFWIQAVAIGLALVALGRVGIWAWPPWWTLYVLGGLLVAATIGSLIRQRPMTSWPRRPFGWFCFAGFAAMGVYAAVIAASTLAMPEGRNIALASPLGPGNYFVANGGAAASVNAHATLLDQTVPAHRPYWGTGHGVDLVALDSWGLRADGVLPADPGRYRIFGRAVVAPCAGTVIATVDGLPDMPVPKADRGHLAGNHVILRCAGADILLGHFRKDSVVVRKDQRLALRAAIAQVGNSGNTSEPHLHISAQAPGTADTPFSGAPIPIRIEGQYLVRNDRLVIIQPWRQP